MVLFFGGKHLYRLMLWYYAWSYATKFRFDEAASRIVLQATQIASLTRRFLLATAAVSAVFVFVSLIMMIFSGIMVT
jgi:hypothetical protein